MGVVCLLADVGDYCEDFDDQEYFSRVKLLPNQTRPIESQIMEHYKEHMYVLRTMFPLLHRMQSFLINL